MEEFDKAKRLWSEQGGQHVVNVVRDDYLSGQALGRRTGTLVRSVNYQVLPTEDGFSYGTNVFYGIAWEQGFNRGAFDVRPVNAKALRFDIGGVTVFAKVAHIPAKTFEPRPFLQPAGEQSIPYLTDLADKLYTDALVEAFQDRVIPTLFKL